LSEEPEPTYLQFLDTDFNTSIEILRKFIDVWQEMQFIPKGSERFSFTLCVSVLKALFLELYYSVPFNVKADKVIIIISTSSN
jgi:hypothetical protein